MKCWQFWLKLNWTWIPIISMYNDPNDFTVLSPRNFDRGTAVGCARTKFTRFEIKSSHAVEAGPANITAFLVMVDKFKQLTTTFKTVSVSTRCCKYTCFIKRWTSTTKSMGTWSYRWSLSRPGLCCRVISVKCNNKIIQISFTPLFVQREFENDFGFDMPKSYRFGSCHTVYV